MLNARYWPREQRTKAPCLDIPFLACCCVGIGISEQSPSTNRQILIQTPLFRARETGLRGVVRNCQVHYGVIGLETDTYCRILVLGVKVVGGLCAVHLQKLVASHLFRIPCTGT